MVGPVVGCREERVRGAVGGRDVDGGGAQRHAGESATRHDERMPSFSHTLDVAAAPEAVYAIIEDTDRTPEWLRRCTRIDNPANGHNSVGTPLTYHYRAAVVAPARWTAASSPTSPAGASR